MTTDAQTLEQLRRDIDRVDDALHDLLVKRAQLVGKVAEAKEPGSVVLRPGREMSILRRLADRHQGALPLAALIRIWREIMGAALGLQQDFVLAVTQPVRGAGYIDLAANHFGQVVPRVIHASPGQVIRMVADGQASAGVVPMPSPADADPWWPALASDAGNLPRVVARLPVAEPEPASNRPETLNAYVVARRDQEETGDDRTLVVVETASDVSRDRLRALMSAAGLAPSAMPSTHRTEGAGLHLVELAGFVHRDDPRLAQLLGNKEAVRHMRVIGGHAMPLILPG